MKVLIYCSEPRTNEEIFERIELYKNTKNHNHHIKPLLVIGWLSQTIPAKPTSKNQKYYTSDLGRKLLDVVSFGRDSSLQRHKIVSSNIASIGYDVDKKTLEVEFHHGAVLTYFDVPESVYEALMSASSHEAYYINEIRDKYKDQKGGVNG